MLPRLTSRQILRTALAVVAAAWLADKADAAAATWVGGSSGGTWSVAGNWNPSGVPANAATANFITNGTSAPTINAAAQIGELLFSSAFSSSFGGTNTLQINGAGGTGIDDGSSNSITFNVNLSINAAQIWQTTSTGSLTFNNQVDLTTRILTLKPAASTTMTFAGAVIGTGGIIQNGSGTTIFTGANTYSGVTTITAGTLQIGAGGATGSVNTSSITDNGTLAFNRTGLVTYSGVISGTGILTQVGSGTTVLTGASTYSGATSITAGTLQIGNAGAAGSLANTSGITDNGTLAINLTNTLTLGAAVTGTGALIQAGTGTTILIGANTYSGATSITAGRLQVGNGGTVGSIVNSDITDNGTLAVNLTNTTTLTGDITGTGVLIQAGTGTTILTGANTYSGATSITAGLLQIGNGGTTGSIASALITDNGALGFNRTDTTTYAGVVSGSGVLIQAGTGTLVLTGANTYSGATSINSGTALQIGNGGTVGSITNSSAITDNGTLAVNLTNTSTLSGAISGTGVLIQAGTGTLVLTGANTYSGATSITAGLLQVGNGGATGSIVNSNITDNGALAFNLSSTTTLNGVISGTGVLIQAGTGTLVLTGANTYSGATTINSGAALQIGNGGTAGSITNSSAIADNGSLIYDLSSNITLPGTISGSGSLTQAGSGTLVVAGTASYTGATTISSGVLQVGNGGATGSIASSSGITDNSVLSINLTGTTTFSNVISGTGAVLQAGSGTTILLAADTYSGATSILSGALQLGNGGAVGSIANSSSIVDNATLIVNRSGSSTLSGVISGTGTLRQAGTGTTTLTGANTYAGGTTISAGALQIGDGGTTGSVAGAITDNSSLIFNRSNSLTESQVISGTGTVTQAGTGTTTLTNTNTYTGGTNINAGTLAITDAGALGNLQGPNANTGLTAINVQSGATLALSGGIKVTSTDTVPGSGPYMAQQLNLNSNGGGTAANLTSNGGINSWEGSINLLGNAAITETAGGLLYLGSGYLNSSDYYFNFLKLNGNTLTLNASGSASQVPSYQLSPDNTGIVYAPTNIFIQSVDISGAGGLTVNGPGTVTLLAMYSNEFTGPTVVNSGTLIVDGAAGVTAIPSTSVVVGSSGGVAAAVLQAGEGAGQTAKNYLIGTYNIGTHVASTDVTIYQNGTYKMFGGEEGFNNLTMVGGTIDEGVANTLLNVSGKIVGVASATTAVIKNGNLGLSANNFTFDIASGTTSSGIDLEVDSAVVDGTGFTEATNLDGLIKTGGGTVMFQGNNSYAGLTQIKQGILAIQSNTGLGEAAAGSLNDGTVVTSGAQLQLQQNPGGGGTNLYIANETLTLAGTGISNTGALLNVSGNNTWSGNIYINGSGSIDANVGTSLNIYSPTLGNLIDGSGAGAALTTGGAGLITVNAGIAGNIGSVIQNGTGTTVLAGSDSYTAGTTVSSGALRLTNNHALAGTGAVVANGATLQLAQDASGGNINENNIATTLNGSGNNSGNGALENVSGNNTYNGAITLGSAAQINADTGSTLRITTGTLTNGGNLLTVGGGGNTTISSPIVGSGGLLKTGSGTLTLNSSANTNTFTGVTSVASGALTFGAANQLKTTNDLAIATGATVNVTDTIQSINAFTGTGTLNFGTSNANSQVTINGADLFSGAFTGTGTIIIPTGASLTLGNNFNDPNLNIILAGGTLFVNGSSDVFGTLTVTANSILDFGTVGLNSVIDFTGNGATGGVSINTGVTLSVNNWVDTLDYFYSTSQPGVRFQVPLCQIVFDAPTWQGSNTTWLTYSDGPDNDHQITPVPEPATYGAIAAAFALLLTGAYAYRRRRAATASA